MMQRSAIRFRASSMVYWTLYADDVDLFSKIIKKATKGFSITKNTFYSKNDNILARQDIFSVFMKTQSIILLNLFIWEKLHQVISPVWSPLQQLAKTVARFIQFREVLTDRNVNMSTWKKFIETCVTSKLTNGDQA